MSIRKTASGGRITGIERPPAQGDPGREAAPMSREAGLHGWTPEDEEQLKRESDGPGDLRPGS